MTILRKPTNNKKKLLDLLKECNIIHAEFTGKLVLNITQGGLQDIDRQEKLNI